MYFEKGIGRLRGYFTVTGKNGDKLLRELPEAGAEPSPPNPAKGTVKVVGGTGKFTGIQGSMEYTRENLRPFADWTHQAICKYRGNWKLP
jgi:hypothetical protein